MYVFIFMEIMIKLELVNKDIIMITATINKEYITKKSKIRIQMARKTRNRNTKYKTSVVILINS